MSILNWAALGKDLRNSADCSIQPAGQTPPVRLAYQFLLDNPECFLIGPDLDSLEWPADMPQEPNIELIAAYYGRI